VRPLTNGASACLFALTLVAVLFVFRPWEPHFAHANQSAPPAPALTGRVLDPQNQPVRGAEITVYVNNDEFEELDAESQGDGSFMVTLNALPDTPFESLRLEILRSHFAPQSWTAGPRELAALRDGQSVHVPDIALERQVTAGFWVATAVFVAMLFIIALERLHNTMASLLSMAVIFGVSFVGGALTHDLFIFDFERSLEYVDFNVIFLLLGMMVVIGITEETGIFQWLAYQAYRISRGRAALLVIILMSITAVASALLDNVTTMLLMAPITLQIAIALDIDPLSLLLPEVMASNIGGISTLIGTPTNILIGSYAGIGFSGFLVNLTPGVLLALAALVGYVLLRYRKQYQGAGSDLSPALLKRLEEGGRIRQPDSLRKAGVVFAAMMALFIFGEDFHLVPAVTALIGAAALLLWVNPDIERMLKVVDWTTLMFFITLFIVIGAVQEVGLIGLIAGALKSATGDSLLIGVLVLVWAAAILSGVIANIPFTAAMLPVAGFLTSTIPGAGNQVLFYGLSVGSAMGGNTSLIGASANLVTAGIAERAGYPITFRRFVSVSLPAMVITVAVGTLWLLIRFSLLIPGG